MRYKEIWSDWRGSRPPRQVVMPGATAQTSGSVRTGGVAFACVRNRYLTWCCYGNMLELTEVSMDHNITPPNAVAIASCDPLLPSSVTVCEADDVVIVTFVTTAHIYRVQLPHPSAVAKDVSVLSYVTTDVIQALPHMLSLTVDTVSSSIVSPQGMFIVCTTRSGVVFMLPPHGGGSIVTTLEVPAISRGVVQRVWQGLLSNGSSAMTTDSVIDLVLISSVDDLVAIAGCRDNTLRLFSYNQQKVVTSYALSEYVTGSADVVAMVRTKQSSVESARFAVFLSLLDRNVVMIFVMASSHELRPVYSTALSPECSLVTWQLSGAEVWLVLTNGDGDTVTMHGIHQSGVSSILMDVAMVTDPELVLSDHMSHRESYLQHISLHYPMSVIETVVVSMAESDKVRSCDLTDMRSGLCRLVETEVQQRITGSCSPQEYRQHQLTHWDQLLGYIKQFHDEQLRPPGGLLLDDNSGMVLLLGQQCASIMMPYVNPVDTVGMATRDSKEVISDVDKLLSCVSTLSKMLMDDDMKVFQIEFGRHDDFDVTAASLAVEIVARGNNALLMELKESFDDVQNVDVAMETLIASFDPICKDDNEEITDDVVMVTVDDLYTGDVSLVTMVTSIRQLVSARIRLCQHSMLMFHIYKLVCSQDFSQSDHSILNSLSYLLQCYHSIHWLTVTTKQSSNSVDIDTTLGRLEISERLPRQQSVRGISLMEYLLRGRLGHVIREVVARRLPISGQLKCWRDVMPLFIKVTIEKCWGSSWSLVCDLLLSNHQYLHAQTYLSLLPSSYHGDRLYQFYLAHSLLLSDPDKSCDLFIGAVAMGMNEELYTYCHDNDDDGSCDPLLVYYRKVISLMEQVSSPPDHVIRIVVDALKLVNDSVLQSLLFKLQIQLNRYEAAYDAMVTITDNSSRMDCLRHFVAVLIDKHEWARLCGFPFSGMEDEVEDVIESRARSLDMTSTHSCYDLLYSYHVSHSNYRKGATVMYEAAHRTGIEVAGDSSMDTVVHLCKQRDYYVASLCSLKLCRHDYQWLVRPDSSNKEDLEVLSYDEISKEYQLVSAKCQLLWKHPEASPEVARSHMSSQEMMSLLLQYGLFDVAFQLGRSLRLSLDTTYDNLATRCVNLTNSLAMIQKLKLSGTSQSEYTWQWVGSNDTDTNMNTRETTVVDNAWMLLRKHLVLNYVKYQAIVARRIISMGTALPQWLIDQYKKSDAAGLLMIYISYNMLEEALLLATEYIDAANGDGPEYFGMDTSIATTWLPHNAFGCLATAIERTLQKLNLTEAYKLFMDKWNQCITNKISCY